MTALSVLSESVGEYQNGMIRSVEFTKGEGGYHFLNIQHLSMLF